VNRQTVISLEGEGAYPFVDHVDLVLPFSSSPQVFSERTDAVQLMVLGRLSALGVVMLRGDNK
jgi:hypothetical protein